MFNKRGFLRISLAVMVVLSASSLAVAKPTGQRTECDGETRTVIDREGKKTEVEYSITFNQEDKIVCISAEHTGSSTTFVGYGISVDGETVPMERGGEFNPGDTLHVRKNVTGWLNVSTNNHSVVIGVYGGSSTFEFYQEIDDSNEGGIPSPYIGDIEVQRNHSSGNVFLKVTGKNYANRSYAPSLMAKTFETQTNRALPDKPNDDTLVYQVELSESPDETVAGELKLYYHWKYSVGKFDRVEFVSKPDGNVTTWDKEFKEVPSLRELNSDQTYENASARKYRDQGPDVTPISDTASKAGAVITVALLIGAIWWRRRSPR